MLTRIWERFWLGYNREGGFEGDEYLAEEIADLIRRMSIKTTVETGTGYGRTTARLAKMADKVYTVEKDVGKRRKIERRLGKLTNVKYFFGDSATVLRERILSGISPPVLFYLDAHQMGNIATLLNELQAISEFPEYKNSAIVIHDFYVPDKNFWHNGYRYEQIVDLLMKINPGHRYYYNTKASGAYRGVIFICPKEVLPESI
ncbi:MAG: hypothetical protein JSW40_08410 [Candidatus Omnitrophota bacterium]|nr:MAG: hypothetical protein JSW40_08410 [Candidatus Omnitrophota bacterium]